MQLPFAELCDNHECTVGFQWHMVFNVRNLTFQTWTFPHKHWSFNNLWQLLRINNTYHIIGNRVKVYTVVKGSKSNKCCCYCGKGCSCRLKLGECPRCWTNHSVKAVFRLMCPNYIPTWKRNRPGESYFGESLWRLADPDHGQASAQKRNADILSPGLAMTMCTTDNAI